MLVFCYVTQSYSQYYSDNAFAAVHEKIRSTHISDCFVMKDLGTLSES